MELSSAAHSTQDKLKNGYETLLLGYAAGILDQAQNLIVSAHLSYKDSAKRFVHSCECIGGALIEQECAPEDMSAGSLQTVLDLLDEHPHDISHANPCAELTGFKFEIPAPLKTPLAEQTKSKWKSIYRGIKGYDLFLDCKKSAVRLIEIAPGYKSPPHTHNGTEITLVLDGAFSDETGEYTVGDLVVTDETFEHTPVANKLQGCTCLIVNTAPIRMTGIHSLLNPFLKT